MPEFDEDYKGPRYTYGLMNRPAGYAQIPEGWIVGSQREHPYFHHGSIDYPFELPEAQVTSFELTPLEGPGLPLWDVWGDSGNGWGWQVSGPYKSRQDAEVAQRAAEQEYPEYKFVCKPREVR